VLSAICLLSYIFHAIAFYVQLNVSSAFMAQSQRDYVLPFFSAMNGNMNAYCLMGICMLLGAGSIAGDQRVNALMVYLSKPITRSDYLVGKWVGLMVSIFTVAVVPSLIFYVVMAAAYSSDGFFTQTHWLLPQILLAALVPSVVLSGLMTGISAWSRSSFTAGALFATLYVLTGIVANIIALAMFQHQVHLVMLVRHASIPGLIDAIAQRVFNAKIPGNRFRNPFSHKLITAPPFSFSLPCALVLVVVSIAAARIKIRAVEVVRG
jgi:ABC-2 type transport system permease protein